MFILIILQKEIIYKKTEIMYTQEKLRMVFPICWGWKLSLWYNLLL